MGPGLAFAPFKQEERADVQSSLGPISQPLRAANWLRKNSENLKRKSALEVVFEGGDGLEKIQQYLKYEFQDLE